MENIKIGEIWSETEQRFISESSPLLSKLLTDSKIDWISSDELLKITYEQVGEFLSRDPVNGFWHPEIYADEVFENFLGNQTFYFDALIRGKNGQAGRSQ